MFRHSSVISALFVLCVALAGCALDPRAGLDSPSAAPKPTAAPPPALASSSPPSLGGGASITASGLTILMGHEKEPEGYGLYSYVLLSNRSDDVIKTYKRALFYLSKWMDTVSNVEAYGTPRSKINCTIVLAAEGRFTPDKLTDHEIESLGDSPNLARSQAILSAIGKTLPVDRGPYIVSYRKPLTSPPNEPDKVLVIDLSDMSDDHGIEAHVVGFTWQVEKPRYWDQPALAATYQQVDKQVRRLSLALDGVIKGVKVYKEDVKVLSGG